MDAGGAQRSRIGGGVSDSAAQRQALGVEQPNLTEAATGSVDQQRSHRMAALPGQTLVGLTGGIASGKSTVSGMLADLGAVVIDHDQLAREVVAAGTPGLAAVVRRFGAQLLAPDGGLDRSRLGALIFGDDAARRDLDAIIHPLVWQRSDELQRAAGADAVIVHDIPLLLETGQQDDFDVLVVVDVPPAEQLQRLIARNGLSRKQAQARIAAQASRAQRLAAADVVIDNSGPREATETQVRALWQRLIDRPRQTGHALNH